MFDYTGCFPDKRLDRRANDFAAAMAKGESVNISKIASTWATQMGFYRFIHNDRAREDQIKHGLTSRCKTLVEGGHKLLIQDTSQINYQHQAPHIRDKSGLGVIGDGVSLGFFLHPSLILDAETEHALGFSHVASWTRPADQPDKYARNYKHLCIEEKESYRWIESVEASRQVLARAEMVTVISDREGDIYDLFDRLPDERTHVLIRSRDNRRLVEGKLFEALSAQPLAGTYTFTLRGDVRKARTGRQAKIAVRFKQVQVSRPRTAGQTSAETITLYAIEARESAETVPEAEPPILWRLLTTHAVTCFSDACRCIYWYTLRWYIEQVFRLLKKRGMDVESSELEQGRSLVKLCLLALGAVLDVLRLLLAREGIYDQPMGHVFTEVEQSCLLDLAETLEGRTKKLRNPHRPRSLAWAAWIIARLGGWKGYQSQRPPGPITYFEGMKRFALTFDGWMLANRDVYNP